jgi:two-component system chemotaxis sensor kinase CheA
VRNCVEHGIEAPTERGAAGKPRTGTISISAERRGESVLIEVGDDGAGVDVARVGERAVDRRVLSAEAVAELTHDEAVSLICRHGLSTAGAVSEISGRGVGLDAVRDAVERLHGSVSVKTRVGEGTVFSLSLPLTVSRMNSVLLEVGRQTLAVPLAAVERILEVGERDVLPVQGRRTVLVDGRPVVLAALADVLGIQASPDLPDGSRRPAAVLAWHNRRAAVVADRVTRTAEVVVEKLPEPVFRVRHVAGASILGSGRVAIILNPGDVLSSVERHQSDRPPLTGTGNEARPTVLVVEDSLTTRTLEKNILEAAGYSVVAAGDGLEAWNILESTGCDLIVSDVQMPRMDGFALTAKVRSDRRFGELPVVLVTARSSEEDRQRGGKAGADAYIVKGAFDQERLLETIRRLL